MGHGDGIHIEIRADTSRSEETLNWSPMTAALLFDLDGTLVDTDAEHLVAFQRTFATRMPPPPR